jgi:hypothetical protein
MKNSAAYIPTAPTTDKGAALSSSELLAAIGDGATLPEVAEKLGMMVVTKHPQQELCDAVTQHLLDGKLTMAGNKLKAANDRTQRRESAAPESK